VLLVDTSVWIEVFKKESRVQLEAVAPLDEITLCLPVFQEVLQGFREEHAFRTAKEALSAFPMVESPLSLEVFEAAAQLYRRARRAGLTVRSGVDCLIATCAIRHELTVLHHDRDFPLLAQVSSLRERMLPKDPPKGS
jgi:predicted nucleic acid-binding protein